MAKKTSAKRPRSASFELSDAAISSNQPLAKKPVLAKKRKVVTPEPSGDDSSVVEIVEPSTPVKAKKPCIKKERIGPLDDPVQITSKQSGANVRHFARRLSFGTIDSDGEYIVPPKQAEVVEGHSNKEKRIRKPSDKAMAHQSMIDALDALEADAVTESSDFPETISIPIKKSTKSKVNKSIALTPKRTSQSSVRDEQEEVHPDAKMISKQKLGRTKSKRPPVSDSEEEPVPPKTPSRKKISPFKLSEKARGKLRAIPDSDHAQSDDNTKDPIGIKQTTPVDWELSDVGLPGEDVVVATPTEVITSAKVVAAATPVDDGIPATEAEPAPEAVDNADPTSTTMLYGFRDQKRHLGGDYTIEMEDKDYNLRGNFSKICPDVLPNPQGPRSLAHALEFTMLDPFINLSRAPIDATDTNAQHYLTVKGPGRPHLAVSLLTGLVTSCNVVVPTHNAYNTAIKRIGVIPFDRWHEPMVDYLGAKFKRTTLYGPVDLHTHIAIASRKQGASGGYSARAESRVPIKLDSKYLSSSTGATPFSPAKGSAWYQRPFPPFLDYDVKIPIYDARALGFNFDKTSFDNLRSLPLYRKPGVKESDVSDLPPNSVATVGFTINAFSDKDKADDGERGLVLLFNLQFVILLGMVGVSTN